MDEIVICNHPYPIGCPKEKRICCICCNEKASCDDKCDYEKCQYKEAEKAKEGKEK